MKNISIIPSLIFLFFTYSSSTYKCDTIFHSTMVELICKDFDSKNNLISEDRYLNGKRNGIQKEWHPNKRLKSIFNFNNDCIIDTVFNYYSSGKLESIIPYKDCKVNGTSLYLYENGDTSIIRFTKNGKKFGTERHYFPNKKPSKCIRYENTGLKHGVSESWFENGNRKDSIVYVNGVIIEERAYFKNGKPRYWTTYTYNNNEPITKLSYSYDPSGKTIGKIVNGTGKEVIYLEDEKTRHYRVFKNGEKVLSRELKPGENPK